MGPGLQQQTAKGLLHHMQNPVADSVISKLAALKTAACSVWPDLVSCLSQSDSHLESNKISKAIHVQIGLVLIWGPHCTGYPPIAACLLR